MKVKENVKKDLLFVLLLFVFQIISSQLLEINKISTDDYPIIKARFKTTDSLGKPLFDITKNNVRLWENDSEREILYLKAPSKIQEPLSVILVFDISGSMKAKRLQIAQEAANTFIEEINGTTFELAITTFSNESYINSDFTDNTTRLKQVVSSINSMGGTCYDSAFMQSKTGIFELTKKARYKKIVIFMTDGLSKAKTDTIISVAQKERITVYCTTIELPMPEILKEISEETGGSYYTKVNDHEKARDIYKDIYNEIVLSDMGFIKWQASTLCEKERQVDFQVKNLMTKSGYSLAELSEHNFMVNPMSFFIRQGKNKKEIMNAICLKVIDRQVVINNISTNSPENITLEEQQFPINMEAGQVEYIRFTCNLKDTGNLHSQIIIETENCLEKKILDVFFEDKGKIEVIEPAGGEIFATGTDVNIRWKGLPKDQEAALFYKNEKLPWQKIGNASGFQYNWTAPKETGKEYQVKVQTANGYDRIVSNIIEGKTGIDNLYDISSDGNMIIYGNRMGQTYLSHLENKNIVSIDKQPGIKFIFFSPDDKKVIISSQNGHFIREIFTNLPDEHFFSSEYKLISSHNSNSGDEYFLPAKIDPDSYTGKITKIIDKSTNTTALLKTGKLKIKYAAISSDGMISVVLSDDNILYYSRNNKNSLHEINRLSPGLSRIIVSPYGKYCYIKYPLNIKVVKISNGKTQLFSDNDYYLRFSPDGNKLMTTDKDRHIKIWDFSKDKKVLDINNPKHCNFSSSGKYVYYCKDEKIFIYDLESEKMLFERYLPGVFHIRLSPDDLEFLVLRNALTEVYDMNTGELTSKLTSPVSGGIFDAFFDLNNRVITCDVSKLNIWEYQMAYKPGISGVFSIISPQPDVLPFYDLGKQEKGKQREIIIPAMIRNSSIFPVKIESLEWEEENPVFNLISGNEGFVLQPGEYKDIEVGFTPDTVGLFATNMIVSTPDSFYLCKITGTGDEKNFELPGKTIFFGKIPLYSHKDTTVELIRNISASNIEITEIKNNGPDTEQFEIISIFENKVLLPKSTLTATLRYNARYNGLSSGTILVHIKNLSQPVIINLLGETVTRKIKIYGKVMNSIDSTTTEADIVCNDLSDNQVVFQGFSDNVQGFCFETNRRRCYLLYAEKEGYISGSETIDLTTFTDKDSIERNLYISELIDGSNFKLYGVFFVFAKAELIKTSRQDLDRVLQILRANPSINLEIHGHTDYIGSEESNLQLSEKRAVAVMNYFMENGITSKRLSIRYFGENHPIADNETEEGRQMNRRVEFVIRK